MVQDEGSLKAHGGGGAKGGVREGSRVRSRTHGALRVPGSKSVAGEGLPGRLSSVG